MHFVFGMAADGAAHPAHPGTAAGAVGRAVVGPADLLAVLSTQLGLSGPPIAPIVRIAAWQARLEAAAQQAPRFYSRSLSTNPWAAARLLLSWRDELVEAGWVPEAPADHGARIADLAAAEAEHSPALPRGRSDLVRQVVRSLESGARLDIDAIELVDDIEFLPPSWRRLLELVAEAGVRVRERAVPASGEHLGDLGRLQRFLTTGVVERLIGDGSVVFIEGRTALMSAEAVADWVAHDPDDGRGTVVVVPDGDSSLLDLALARRNLPALGLSPRSPHRGSLQMLALAFAVVWRPFDPRKLVELLLLPRPPLARWAARLLAAALSREPGTGGAEWDAAWRKIEAKLPEYDGQATDEAATLVDWRAWMDVGLHDRLSGIPADAAVAICRRVREWALATDAGGLDPLLLCAVGAADALAEAFGALGRSTVSSTQVDGMLDAVLAEGLADPAHVAEEGHLRSVTRPGAIWAAAESVVWWNFAGVPGGARRRPWTDVEATSLATAGCRLEPASLVTRREASEWTRTVLCARQTLILVTPLLDRGVEQSSHPLAHRVAPLLAKTGRRTVAIDAEDLLAREIVRLGNREIIRRPEARLALPPARARWDLPVSLSEAIAGRLESASSLQDLVQCQLRWVLKHVARLKVGGTRAIPDRERLLGNLAHAVALLAFKSGEVPDPAEVHREALAGIDALVGRIAAPLRLAGYSGEMAFARDRIPASLETLASLLSERGMAVVGMEVERRATIGAMPVRSRIDMVVRDRAGSQRVIDLKWTSYPSARRREVADGLAVQLATYGRLIEPALGAPAAYYLLRQRLMVAGPASGLASEEVPVARSLDETWDAIACDWEQLAGLAGAGHGLALGVAGVEQHLPEGLGFPVGAKVCAFCDMGDVCRIQQEE